MATTTHTQQRSVSEVRAARLALLVSLLGTLVLAFGWFFRRSWRRLLPVYWVLAGLALAWVSGPLGIAWGTIAVAVLAMTAVAVCWPARSRAVRAWRATIVVALGAVAAGTAAAGGPDAMAAHPMATIFLPTLLGAVLGWPWWHHLRQHPVAAPVMPESSDAPVIPTVDPLTAHWARRWQTEVVDARVCEGTTLVHATSPRAGVTEAIVRLAPGTRPKQIIRTGPDVEVAMDLDEGAVGWRTTGKTARLQVILVEQSYVAGGVPWTGPTYADGRCQIATFTDGSPGHWIVSRPGFGVLGGLMVGSTGAGKSRAVGVLIANLLEAGVQVVIGDPQNGQSLPAWKDAVEYHSGVDKTILLARRLHAEVMRRSALLAGVGVDAFDENDPRVKALGLRRLIVIIDECQLVLVPNTPLVGLVEQVAETMRKTGVGLVLATQLPQMRSLGGSVRLRDALVAGNALILRLSNRGSGTTILPDDFVGDPFALEPEIDGRTTAGMGYLRHSPRVGMLCRVPHLDEAAAAAAAPRVPVRWQVPPVDPTTPIKAPGAKTTTTVSASTGQTTATSAVDRLRAAFTGGGKTTGQVAQQQVVVEAQPVSTADWVLACLRRGPASAQVLLDRPDCPVNQAQLYAVLTRLKEAKRITPPVQRGGAWTISA
ncbi:hypothetical protein AWW66_22270 [Micromonospora rosaria]|uniref:Helicase HerA central domain-containing protein n=1 Tax=Micromonospora rosaria TaxID=47874 RepID=A0A136PN32_9ACTN|nr:DUF87 domain-containing protein [Micromonospora rosaria]KXK59802.1 hypothetical protein AWW66_22270 [Micromonospora rosaria]